MKSKLINWLLPILALVLVVLETGFELIKQAIEVFSLDPNLVGYIRFAILFITAILLKLQPPSIAKAKRYRHQTQTK